MATPSRDVALAATQLADDSSDTDSVSSDSGVEDEPSRFCPCCSRRRPEEDALNQSNGDEAASPPKQRAFFTAPGNTDRDMSHDHSPHVTDEVFNAASHLMGGMLSVLGTAVLVTGAAAHGDPWAIVSFAVYGTTLMFLFFASFAHHGIRGSDRLMKVLRTLDYTAIYFLIPGTMTPVCLILLHDRWEGWVFFGACWFLALLGVIVQTACKGGLAFPKWASMTVYVTLGWFGALLAIPAGAKMGTMGLALLAAGGVAYTGGGVIFQMEKPNPVPGVFGFHEIWHIFVLLGAGLHFAAIFLCVYPHMEGYAAAA